MNILGLHGHAKREDEEHRAGWAWHDAAAVLYRDGVLIAAIEEERLNRLKHANTFPWRAIRHCLSRGGISLADVDCVAINRGEVFADRSVLADWIADPASRVNSAGRHYAECFRRAFGTDVDVDRFLFCPHHLAHAWSTFIPSGFDDALVFVADGDGDNLSGAIYAGHGRELTPLREYSIGQSLGNLYTSIIALIGYGRFDEYKAMGLAPYGDPSIFRDVFEPCYRLLPDGDYRIEPLDTWAAMLGGTGLLDRARRKGEAFTREHMDIAAALQAAIERIILHVVHCYRESTGIRRLCLAGGVAHNCSANGAILYSRLFDDVFVQPASHDAGGAVGAAIAAAVAHGEPLRAGRWAHVHFGTDAGCGAALERTLRRWESLVEIEPLGAAAADRVAGLLAGGAVVGWVQGRSEFGPRALGNRSILADPRPADNKARINAMVKKRESFRPFAPAVLVERVRDYFEVPGEQDDMPFMTFVLKVRPEHRERLGAVTHVDGSARVQTVSRATNPRFWELIRAFDAQTGVGMLLNTSFNNNAEPIVDSPDDAVACYLTTKLDALVIGDFLVRKRWPEIPPCRLIELSPLLAPSRRVVLRQRLNPASGALEQASVVESTRGASFGPCDSPVSPAVYRLLQQADGRRALSAVAEAACVPASALNAACEELAELWAARVIALRPSSETP